MHYSVEIKSKLLQVARHTIEKFLKNGSCATDILCGGCIGEAISVAQIDTFPELLVKKGVFVALKAKETKTLRGCMGEFKPLYPLIEATARNAISCTITDPRFSPVIINELDNLYIEISVISPITRAKPEDVEIGKHGIMINKGFKGALFLPNVPVEKNWDLNTFLEALCHKASLPKGSWHDHDIEFDIFESETWNENY